MRALGIGERAGERAQRFERSFLRKDRPVKATRLSPLLTAFGVAVPSIAWASPTVTVTAPASNGVVTDSVTVTGSVQSAITLASVHGQVVAPGSDLALVGNNFSGDVDLSAAAIGPVTLTVTATDTVGGTGSTDVPLIHDHAPTITVTTLEGTVARSSVRLQATCADADMYGCQSVSVSTSGTPLATANGTALDQTVSLGSYEGQALTLTFTATDTQGLKTSATRTVYVDTSPLLNPVATVDGPILDFDATRILFSTPQGITLRTRATSNDVVLSPTPQTYGHLTSLGAIWPGGELRNGVTTPNTATSVVAQGDYALLFTADVPTWRDVVNDVTTPIPTGSGSFGIGADIAANGVAALSWIPQGSIEQQIYTYVGGTFALLPHLSATTRYVMPLTDGTSIVFHQHLLGGSTRPPVFLSDLAGNETALTAQGTITSQPEEWPPADYQINGGWVAFTNTPNGTPIVVYTRSPSGTVAAVSPFNASTAIDAVSPTGEVVFAVAGGARYVGRAGGGMPATYSNSFLGRSVYADSSWYVMMGRTLFVHEPGGTDGGAPEAGADAGPQDAGGDATARDASASDAGADAETLGDASHPDATSGEADASVREDAGSAVTPVPTPPPDESGDGGGGGAVCSSSSSPGATGWLVLAIAACGALVRRRSRRA
jgi:hypothetical protein